MIIHLVDGTYELFRQFYGIRRFKKSDPPFGAVAGVLRLVAKMIEDGATHIAVATDHVIESFRNNLWSGYKTGAGIEPALYAQFEPLEKALASMGIAVWAMVEFEADDALASGAYLAARDKRVQKVCIWTPDKDLAQCVVGERVVQVDRRSGQIRDEAAVEAKFGVAPEYIPDYLALVGDAADGYPGLAGLGPKGAGKLIRQYGHIEEFPLEVLGANRQRALLFKDLAILRVDVPLYSLKVLPYPEPVGKSKNPPWRVEPAISPLRDVDDLRWEGPTALFEAVAAKVDDAALAKRVRNLHRRAALS